MVVNATEGIKIGKGRGMLQARVEGVSQAGIEEGPQVFAPACI